MSYHILIADDEPEILELYRLILEPEKNFVVELAKNGKEAVERYIKMQKKPDIVIMDHRMPVKDGNQATKEILSYNGNAKIIFASADSSVKDSALMIGAKDFLTKPFSIKVLIEHIKKILSE
ncbi:MAG: response regulator [Candidatus Methanofastidiosia archaeon]